MRWFLLFALVACEANPSKLDHIAQPDKPKKPTAPISFDAAAIDAWVAAEIADRGAIGASLVVVRDGKTVFAKGYGKKHGDQPDAVTPDTAFAIGSLSKQFACAAAHILAARGKLALTDKVVKYYPQATRANDITLADLGGHIGGYRDWYPLDYVDERLLKPIAPDDIIAQYAGMPLDFEPRTRWSYSNTGYTILARAIEKASGTTYDKVLDEAIFKPLGMTTASLVKPNGAATGHVSFLTDTQKPAPFEAPGWLFGAGDLWMSAVDLAKWDVAFAEGKLLSAEALDAMSTPLTLTDGRSTNYSCGFFIRSTSGETVLSHGGWVGGFYALHAFVPRTRTAVVLLTNDERVDLGDVHDKVLHLAITPDVAPAVAGPPAAEAVRELILQLQRGTIDRSKLGDDANAYFDDARIKASSIRTLGDPTVTLKARNERGGQEVTVLSVAFPSKTYTGVMFRTPDGKIRQLLLTP